MEIGMEYKKVEEKINDIKNENLKKLSQLFPAAIKDGKVDFEALKEELGEFKAVGSEKYELNWAGKLKAKKVAQEDVSGRTLKYVPVDSKNSETTENLYIEGDNLEVLKLLRQNYYGAIKMIYIDPPYNTGNDFVYKDKFSVSVEESEITEGNRNELGEQYTVNSKSQNRYHANWLNMIYPRIKIAKDLLKEDGAIVISIDDNEVDNLKKMCNEVFGENNYIATFPWRKRTAKSDVPFGVSQDYEWIVCYAKTSEFMAGIETSSRKYYESDDYKGRPWRIHDMTTQRTALERPNSNFALVNPKNGRDYPVNSQAVWRVTKDTFENFYNAGCIIFPGEYEFLNIKNPVMRYFKDDDAKKDGKMFGFSAVSTNLPSNVGMSQDGTKTIKDLFEDKVFSYPKPVELLKYLCEIMIPVDKSSIILDFFSGSATLSQAVMELNAEKDRNHKYILVQLSELCDKKSDAFNNGYSTISDIGKERIRRAGDKIIANNPDLEGKLDIGFKVFKVDNTNIKWNLINESNDQITTDTADYLPDLMDFVTDSKDVDIVYELMLRQNDVPLSSSLEVLSEIGKRAYLYASSYLVCLETQITEKLVDKLAALNPLPIKFIFRDSAFQDDIALKDETFRRLKALIEKNSGNTKKTYTVEFI